MSEFDESEIENEEPTTEVAIEAEVDEEETEDTTTVAEDKKDEAQDPDEVLIDKASKAARLLRTRSAALRHEKEENEGKPSLLVRALKLLELKPKMEQKEMADLLGVRLRELDAIMAEAEKDDIVARIEPEEPDMRKIVIMADDDAIARAEAKEAKGEDLVPGLSDEDRKQLLALLDKVIDPLVALGLDEDRGPRGDRRGGGRDDRGPRGGFHGGRDDHGSRGSFGGRGSRGGDRGERSRGNDRGGYRGGRDRDDRGSRGGYRSGARDDRSGGFRGGRDDRSSSRGGYGSSSRGNDRGGYRGSRDRDDRNSRGGYRGGSRY